MHALILRTDAGHRLLSRYRRTLNNRDLDQSIKHFKRAYDLCPTDHLCRPVALFNLATVKFVSCQTSGSYPDLDDPISLFQDTLDLRPTGHPDRPATQLHLAVALLSRFVKGHCQIDADAAEESLNANHVGMEGTTTPMLPCLPDKLFHRANLCNIEDLHKAIALHRETLALRPVGHPDRSSSLNNLANGLCTRFKHLFDPSSICLPAIMKKRPRQLSEGYCI
ncbi:hypothetical protein DFJ58DRAFT_660061 [Suillus subalutaceus]|uniref:uncharacterized protein n=1 Tax=Suillus subalutaceus TaxID=48586 RepID=UPI001B86AEF3|nr:uncharacterized protein DFJ58DRAFT_660061 [Suillus subalutaceus]KAG1855216.1 hypothetical protein DFJ58DRAFT_660061 [Suillus subalutaceus]